MNYLTKQKFNIRELVVLPKLTVKVLLVIGEDSLRGIYENHLRVNEFEVYVPENLGRYFGISEYLKEVDLLVVDLYDEEERKKLRFLQNVLENFPRVSVITVGTSLNEQLIQKLMDLGISGHIDRRFSKPTDLILMARTLFKF